MHKKWGGAEIWQHSSDNIHLKTDQNSSEVYGHYAHPQTHSFDHNPTWFVCAQFAFTRLGLGISCQSGG